MILSFLVISAIAWILASVFGVDGSSFIETVSTSRVFHLYFLVAFSSGIAATLAWARREMTDVLPGVAMAVSIVPPVSLIGISLNNSDLALVGFYFSVFIFNLIGLILGGFIVYTLLKFYKMRKEVEKEVEE